jgi:hypothetical protein
MEYPLLTLSTDHAASNYGQPVLVAGGVAYGPLDLVRIGGRVVTACELVRSLAIPRPEDPDAARLVAQFCGEESEP